VCYIIHPALILLEYRFHPLLSLNRMGLKRPRTDGDSEAWSGSPVVVREDDTEVREDDTEAVREDDTEAVSTEETEDKPNESRIGGVVDKDMEYEVARVVSTEVVEVEEEEKDLVEYQLEDGR
jgi:hypothetical protein